VFGYYFEQALRSLRRNPALTALMIVAVGIGVGASMTTLSVSRAMTGDPIPDRSQRLFMVQLDSWGPVKPDEQTEDNLEESLSYIDVKGLMQLRAAARQTPVYTTLLKIRPADPKLKAAQAIVPSVTADFFTMFEAPFKFGGPWSRADDQDGNPVVVISRKLNDEFFGGADSVGKSLVLDGATYRVVGVLAEWPVVPRFYNLRVRPYGRIDELFIPFERAIRLQGPVIPGIACNESTVAGFDALLRSECLWLQLWVELPTPAEVAKYRAVLTGYAADQQRIGRFHWPPHTQIRDVMQWLQYRHIVPNELNLLLLASFGFLLVCLLNAMALMLARVIGRSQDLSVRRALGASRAAIMTQYLVETLVIGLLGAVLGLVLTMLGTLIMHTVLADDFAALTYLNAKVIGIEVALAIAATLGAGLYPVWRAASIEPALQLKAE
jgi:putative ABC transport system permease protein